MNEKKYGYKAFYNGKTLELYADSLYEAKKLAVAQFKVKPNKAHMVSVMLCEKDGEPVIHTPDF